MGPLDGDLEYVIPVIVGYLDEPADLEGFLSSEGSVELIGDLSQELPDKELYAGPYEATPQADAIVLDTDDKILARDITVNPIPYYETTNESGGYTVIIG